MKYSLIMLFFVLGACASSSSKKGTKSETAKLPNAQAGKKIAAAPSPLGSQFAKEMELVKLKKKNQPQGRTMTSELPAFSQVTPQNKRIELNLKNPSNTVGAMSEDKLLSEMQDQYDLNNEWGFQSRYQAFCSRFAKSSRINEAHYMAGLLSLSNKNYGPAVKAFDLILKKSPKSSQAPKAMFAKAMTYRRMNLTESAKPLLAKVISQYPQSLEAKRADIELKILERRFQ